MVVLINLIIICAKKGFQLNLLEMAEKTWRLC